LSATDAELRRICNRCWLLILHVICRHVYIHHMPRDISQVTQRCNQPRRMLISRSKLHIQGADSLRP